jgi:hypothetical protein
MKKFKNIRLMLLGLLAMGGMNAFAAVDDLKTDGTYWYQVIDEGQATVAFCGLSRVATPTKEITIPKTATLKNDLYKDTEYTVVAAWKAGDKTDGKWWEKVSDYTQDVTGVTSLTFDVVIDNTGTNNTWNKIVKPAIEKFATTLATLVVTDARNISELPKLNKAATYVELTTLNLGGVKNGGNAITLPVEFVKEQSFKSLVLPTEPLKIEGAAFAYVQGLKADGTPQALSINTEKAVSFGKWAFLDANITSVIIGAECTDIGDDAFAADAADKAFLKSVTWKTNKFISPTEPKLPYVKAVFDGQININSITISAKNVYTIEKGTFKDIVSSATAPIEVFLTGSESLTNLLDAFDGTVPYFKTLDLKDANLTAANGKVSDIIDLSNSNNTLETLKLPKTINTLEAFNDFVKLSTIDLEKTGITEIPDNGFKNCVKLANFTLPAATTSIGEYAFYGTTLNAITIPATVTTIKQYAYANIERDVDQTPDGSTKWYKGIALTFEIGSNGKSALATLGNYAFANTNIEGTVDFTKTNVKKIPAGLFAKTPITTDVNWWLPSSTGWVMKSALTGVVFNAGVSDSDNAEIGAEAFQNNVYLATADLNKAFLTSIGASAFENTALSSVTLTDTKVKVINSKAFAGIPTLTTATLNVETTNIGTSAFDGDIALTTVNWTALTKLQVIGDYAFNQSAIANLDLSAATSLERIRSYAFGQYKDAKGEWHPALTTITFPAETCTDLTSKDKSYKEKYSNKIQIIDPQAFFGASKLTKMNNLKDCKLTEINQWFTANLDADIDKAASAVDDQTTICPAELGSEENGALVLPSEIWFAQEWATGRSLKTINNYAFQGLGLEKFEIPATVTSFGACVFQGNTNLKEVKWMDAAPTVCGWNPTNPSATAIHKYTFRGDSNLEKFYYMTAKSLKSLDLQDIFFYWCSKDKLRVYVTSESLKVLEADGYTTANAKYSKLNDELTDEIELSALNTADNMYYRTYYNKEYSTWIKASDDLKVYTAQFNGAKVEMVEADVEGGYYKMEKLGSANDEKAVAIIASKTQKVQVEYYALEGNNKSTLKDKYNEMKVTSSEMAASKLKYYFKLGKGPQGIGFYRITTGKFKAGAVYLEAADVAARADFYAIGGEETAIKAIEQMVEDDAPVYNLQGVQVKTAQKGMFIKNGKKFIVK